MPMPLTRDEIHTAWLLRCESKTVAEIARVLGRDPALIEHACRNFTMKRVAERPVKTLIIPDGVMAEREYRLSLRPRDLTAAIAGDPLPGMSALEKKRRRA
jgi:hypothetical protein